MSLLGQAKLLTSSVGADCPSCLCSECVVVWATKDSSGFGQGGFKCNPSLAFNIAGAFIEGHTLATRDLEGNK
jgi:hypothetical protein